MSLPECDLDIHVDASPLEVSYGPVLSELEKLYVAYPNPDLVLHIGLAAGTSGCRIEIVARREPYNSPGMDGKVLEPGQLENAGYSNTPYVLLSGVRADDILEKWKSLSKEENVPLSISTNAGLYLCEFAIYCSMARAWLKRNALASAKMAPALEKLEDPSVLFLHIDDGIDEEKIAKNARVTEALLKAMAISRITNGAGTIEGKSEYNDSQIQRLWYKFLEAWKCLL
jgi:pyrrolidone-carboxylate peptidase